MLTTERLILRPWRDADRAAVGAYFVCVIFVYPLFCKVIDHFNLLDYGDNCKHPGKTAHSLLEIFRHTDYVP